MVSIIDAIDYALEVLEDHEGPEAVKETIKRALRMYGLDEYIAYEWLEQQKEQPQQQEDKEKGGDY